MLPPNVCFIFLDYILLFCKFGSVFKELRVEIDLFFVILIVFELLEITDLLMSTCYSTSFFLLILAVWIESGSLMFSCISGIILSLLLEILAINCYLSVNRRLKSRIIEY